MSARWDGGSEFCPFPLIRSLEDRTQRLKLSRLGVWKIGRETGAQRSKRWRISSIRMGTPGVCPANIGSSPAPLLGATSTVPRLAWRS